MKILHALVAAAALLPTMNALASPELARQRLCMSCHAVDRKVIGPAFQDVARRYAADPAAAARLARVIAEGGRGNWGTLPMPANPRVTPEEAQRLAAWVLTHK
jgi:cytochrome c